jgi:hypothetical protein
MAARIENSGLKPTIKAMLHLVYEEALGDLRQGYNISTDFKVRDAVAEALVALGSRGETNSYQLRQHAVDRGLAVVSRTGQEAGKRHIQAWTIFHW